MVRADFLTGLFLVVMSVYVILESWRMPRFQELGAHPLSAPGIVPAFLAAILIVFGAILIGRSIRAGGHRLELSHEKARAILGRPGNRRLLLTAALCVGYAGVLIGRVPYPLATGLFIFAFVVLFEWEPGLPAGRSVRIFGAAAVLAVAMAWMVSWVFERLFLVTLP
ncbi:MAG: tripartite tricarboxylate transporter TctB family protein [Candidatus Methylomirabilales bacterium]